MADERPSVYIHAMHMMTLTFGQVRLSWKFVSLLIVLLAAFGYHAVTKWSEFWDGGPNDPTTLEGAKIALDFIKEWSIWMAGLAAGGLAHLGNLAKDLVRHRRKRIEIKIATVILGASILLTSLVLASIPPIAIRVHGSTIQGISPFFDVYNQPIFGWAGSLPLGAIYTFQHWCFWFGSIAVVWCSYPVSPEESSKKRTTASDKDA